MAAYGADCAWAKVVAVQVKVEGEGGVAQPPQAADQPLHHGGLCVMQKKSTHVS